MDSDWCCRENVTLMFVTLQILHLIWTDLPVESASSIYLRNFLLGFSMSLILIYHHQHPTSTLLLATIQTDAITQTPFHLAGIGCFFQSGYFLPRFTRVKVDVFIAILQENNFSAVFFATLNYSADSKMWPFLLSIAFFLFNTWIKRDKELGNLSKDQAVKCCDVHMYVVYKDRRAARQQDRDDFNQTRYETMCNM